MQQGVMVAQALPTAMTLPRPLLTLALRQQVERGKTPRPTSNLPTRTVSEGERERESEREREGEREGGEGRGREREAGREGGGGVFAVL